VRIAFVNSTKKWTGVKTWCLDTGRALQEQGHEVWIFGRAGVFVDRARVLGLRAEEVEFGPDFDLALIRRFRGLFARGRVERVVVNVAKDMRTAGVAARSLGIPVVQHLGAPGDLRNTLKIRLTLRLLRPHLVTCSEFVRRELLERVPLLRRSDFVAIHPGTAASDTPPGPPRAERVLISTSRLDPDKAHAELLEAAAALCAGGLAFRLVILGTGAMEGELRSRARALGLEERITWAGFQADVRPFLREADVFVLPSICEPLGIALQEAMAQGLVPIARRAGGVPEIWPPGMEELLWAPREGARGLQTVLRRVLLAPDAELCAWKTRAWMHAGRAFDLHRQSRRFAAWLEGLPGPRGARRVAGDGAVPRLESRGPGGGSALNRWEFHQRMS
jgi:glycosyltransferase involved in cell wall biosynthesis